MIALIWWVLLAGLIIFIDPEKLGNIYSYGLFLGLLSVAVWSTASMMFKNKRRVMLITLVIVGFALLRLIKLGYWLNGVLLVGLAVVIDSVFTKRV